MEASHIDPVNDSESDYLTEIHIKLQDYLENLVMYYLKHLVFYCISFAMNYFCPKETK